MEEQANVRVPAGKLFCFSSGEYSDYGYEGHFLALVDITNDVLAEARDKAEARAKVEPDQYGDIPEEDWEIQNETRNRFIPELIRLGVILSVDCVEIHIGSYGRLDWA